MSILPYDAGERVGSPTTRGGRACKGQVACLPYLSEVVSFERIPFKSTSYLGSVNEVTFKSIWSFTIRTWSKSVHIAEKNFAGKRRWSFICASILRYSNSSNFSTFLAYFSHNSHFRTKSRSHICATSAARPTRPARRSRAICRTHTRWPFRRGLPASNIKR